MTISVPAIAAEVRAKDGAAQAEVRPQRALEEPYERREVESTRGREMVLRSVVLGVVRNCIG